MNSKSRAGERALRPVRERVAPWRRLLERCGAKATRKRVHALRVVTLRLQAELERDVTDLPETSREALAIRRFLKQAEKLRKALSPVRALDVWIGKLRDLRESLTETVEYVPRSQQETTRGIDRLEERLQRKRDAAEKKLLAQIGKRGSSLVGTSEDVERELSDYVFGERAGIASDLIERFRAVKADFPAFDEENLHEFRKRIKMVRYLAEIHAGADRACAQLATQMKKMQSAIGEWHDLQELAGEARGHRGRSKELAELLDTLSAESFEAALSIVHAVSATMLGECTPQQEASDIEDRKLPVSSHYASPEGMRKVRA